MTHSDFIQGWINANDSGNQIIAVRVPFIRMLGGNGNDAILLSQILYWNMPSKEGQTKLRVRRDGELWLAKAHKDWEAETGINEHTARRSIERLKKEKLIATKVMRFGGNPTVHIRVVWEELEKRLKEDSREPEPNEQSAHNQMHKVDKTKRAKGADHITETTPKEHSRENTTTTPEGSGGFSCSSSTSSDLESNAQICADRAVSLMDAHGLKTSVTQTLLKACKGKDIATVTLNTLAVAEHHVTGKPIKSAQAMLTRALQQNWAPSHGSFTGNGLSEGGKQLYVRQYAIAAEKLGYITEVSFHQDEYFYTTDGQPYRCPYSMLPLMPVEGVTLQSMWADIHFQEVA